MPSRNPDPSASLRLMERANRLNPGPKLYGGTFPASGARVRRNDGTTTAAMSFAAAGRIVVQNGGELVNAHTGEVVSADVAAKAAQLPMSSSEAHGKK